IQEKDAEFLNKKLSKQGEPSIEPLYTAEDAAAAMKLFRGVPYGSEFSVLENLTAEYVDAGHILGSASVRVKAKGNGVTRLIGFTGDLGPKNLPIVKDP